MRKKPLKVSETLVTKNNHRKILNRNFISKKWEENSFIVSSSVWNKKVVVILPIGEEKQIIFTEEFRYWPELYIIGFPSGAVEENEGWGDAAKRELSEETWYFSKEIIYLWRSIVWAYDTGFVEYYAARDMIYKNHDLESTEYIETKKTTTSNFEKMILKWEVLSPLSVNCFYLAKAKWLI